MKSFRLAICPLPPPTLQNIIVEAAKRRWIASCTTGSRRHPYHMLSFLSIHRRPSPLRSLSVLLILLVAVPACIALAESRTASSPSSPDKILPDSIIFGFDLGQSYGTSVARFENGTTISLAKIPGTANYVNLMEDLVAQPPTPYWLSHFGEVGRWLGLFRSLRRSLGLAPTKDSRILADMIVALKTASEIALQTQVKAVAVTAPWIAAWDNRMPYDSVVKDALSLAGLELWDNPWEEAGHYLGEIGAALASEERWICRRNWCALHWVEVEGEATEGGPLFLVSLTNRSLYTSFQLNQCYFFNSWDNHLASINPRYGLDQASQTESPSKFWNELRLHLLSLYKTHKAGELQREGRLSQLPLTILVMGEAAETPEFLDVVHDVARDIQQLCASEPQAVGCKENKAVGGVELLILGDRTYGPARGAAFWLSTRMSPEYCEELYAAEGILRQSDMMKESHLEL
ncbi:hypothetical protein QBC40DRAFT_279630 [Triangularia verruculosa]|uniref:Uncharacterized protein n=1 Tax=Triangularia verruculosa TaxID=2587418 RepID=A0AAN7AW16_9PEZI|nr:hypothetical protein QBC40DRAFT_279630 [Triangularia verruculosa]